MEKIIYVFWLMFAAGVLCLLIRKRRRFRLERLAGIADVKKIGKIALSRMRLPFLDSWQQEKKDSEIYEALSYMHNLVAAHGGNISLDEVVSELARCEGILRKTYIGMLSLIRTGRLKEAEALLRNTVRTETGTRFAALLVSWEETDPSELAEIIVSCRQDIRETCITREKRNDEIVSDLIYFPATVNVFVIFINFVYISYFMQQKEMMQIFF